MEQAQFEEILRQKLIEIAANVRKPYLANLMMTGAEALGELVSSPDHDMAVQAILDLYQCTDEEIVKYLIVDSEISMEEMRDEIAKRIEPIKTEQDIAGDLLLNLLCEAIG
jgi:hypothetical protein